MAFHKVVGIDLGTTYSAVSVWDNERDDVVVVPTSTGSSTLPSVIGLDPESKVIVGAQAQNNLIMDPANTIIEVKRLMGTYSREPDPKTGDPGEPLRIPFRGRQYLPQEISAFILMELKRMAENFIGEPIHDAVITTPAYFKEPQMGATADAAAIARLNLKRLLNEPTAAAVCFGADKVRDGRTHVYAVYDLGGGTFDVSIIEVSEGSVSVVGTGGNPRLGGGDFDDRITGWAIEQIFDKHKVNLANDPAIWARIKREAEMRKRDLSAATSTVLNLPYLTPQLSVNLTITRPIFESLIDDLLLQSLACLDEAIESAYKSNSIERDAIEQVLLVGGSTRILKCRTMLADHMGMDIKDIRCDFNPDEVVARGAAIVARAFNRSESFEGKEVVIDMSVPTAEGQAAAEVPTRAAIILRDVTSHTLGILANQSDFIPIIPKESQLPRRESRGGFINGGRTKEIPVLIFQGEEKVAFDNTLIGKLPIVLPEEKEEGYYKFEVIFDLDSNGLLNVQVKCLNDGTIWETKMQCNVRASSDQIRESAQNAQDVMAPNQQDAGTAAPAVSALPRPPGSLPRPPARPNAAPVPAASSYARPPASAATATAPAPAAVLAPPPAQTPDQFKSIARRSFNKLSQMPASDKRDRLLAAYSEFVAAVQSGSENQEMAGDELADIYTICIQ
jgi:molecular chaperone DnaK